MVNLALSRSNYDEMLRTALQGGVTPCEWDYDADINTDQF